MPLVGDGHLSYSQIRHLDWVIVSTESVIVSTESDENVSMQIVRTMLYLILRRTLDKTHLVQHTPAGSSFAMVIRNPN